MVGHWLDITPAILCIQQFPIITHLLRIFTFLMVTNIRDSHLLFLTGVCKSLCRKDDDCGAGEVCEGLVCSKGCRSNSGCPDDRSCVGNKCVNICDSPTACGTNAECSVVNHQKNCKCPEPLTGNPLEGCKYPTTPCYEDGECLNGRVCYGGFCEGMCRT